MKPRISALAICTLFLAQAASGAVYKCTADNGSVSYQDQPCPGEAVQREIPSTKKVTIEGSDIEFVQVLVPGVGMAVVGLFDHMEYMARQHDNRASTIAVRSKSGHEPMEMQITFFANEYGANATHRQVDGKLGSLDPALRRPTMPPGSENWSFKTAIGDARMISHYSPGGGPSSGKWDTVTVGYVAHPQVIAAVTILNNGKTSESLRSALKVYNMFQVVVGNKVLE